MKKNSWLKTSIGLFAVLIVKPAWCQDLGVTAGEGILANGGTLQNVSSPFTFLVVPTANRSYCCTVNADNTEPFINSFFHTPVGHEDSTITFAARGGVEPVIVANTVLKGAFENARACFIAPFSSASTATVHFGGVSGNDIANNVSVRCDETSLYGGYNTSAGELNYLEITNTTDANLVVHIIATNEFASGATVIDQNLNLGGNRRFDLGIHELVPAGAFGSVKVLHDGPPGALSVAVSEYKITSSNPLNFILIGRVPFAPRRNL